MGLFDDLVKGTENKGEKGKGGLFDDLVTQTQVAPTQEKPKRSFLQNVFHGLQQLQRPQSAIATAFHENIETGKKDYERRQAGGETDPFLTTKMALNIPGALWRGATAKTENLKDFTDVARAMNVDPYRGITDAWQDVHSGTSNPVIATGKTIANIPILAAEVGANLIADPLNWVGIGGVTKLGKAAQLNKAAQIAGEAITATSKLGKELSAAERAGKAILPGATAREQALLGQKAALTFAGQSMLPAKTNAAILGGVEDIAAKVTEQPWAQNLTDLFVTTKNPELKTSQSKLRASLQNVASEGQREAIGLRENAKAIAQQEGISVDDLTKQLGERIESLSGSKKGSLPIEVMADEYKAAKAAQLEARELAGLNPARLGGKLNTQLAELKGEYASRLGQRGANIIKIANKRMNTLETKIGNLETAIKDEVLRASGNPDGLIRAQKAAYMDYFGEIGKMNRLLDKSDPATIRQLEPKIAALEANLAANPDYAIHALTPEAMDFVGKRRGTSVKVGGEVISLENPSDIARTFNLEPIIAEKLKGLGFTDLDGVGKTVNDIRIVARMKPLPTGDKLAVPGRSLTRKEVNALAETGQLPGYEGVRFSATKPIDLQNGEQWVRNEFFYSDPLVGRAIETMRTNKQLTYKKFMDEVAEKFGDPNGEEFRGIKVRPEIARDLNKYVITLERPPNQLIDSIVKGVSTATDIWKTLATSANPGFHIRNFISGVWTNTALGNVHNPAMYQAAMGILSPNKRYNNAIGSVLSKIKEQTGREYTFDFLADKAKEYGLIGSGIIGTDIKELAPALGKSPNAIQKLDQLGNMAGRTVEGINRLALWLDQLTKGNTLDGAASVVHKLQFDYGDVTRFEQGVKIAIPFYTWLRKNIALQVEEMLQRPGRYNSFSGKWLREIEKTGGEVSEEEKQLRPDYFGQFGFTRTGLKGSKGSPVYLNPNLPFQDLRQLNPLDAGQNITGALNPAISTMLQLGFNKDFRNRDLASYISSDQVFPFQGAHVPARGAGNALYPFYGQGPVFAHPDRRETKVPPQLQFLLNRVPLAANLGEWLFSNKANPDEEKIKTILPFLGDIDTGVLSGMGGVKLTPLDIEQARAIQRLKRKADQQAKNMQQRKEGRL